MGAPQLLPAAATPIERILSRFDRQQIADFIEIAISLLDVANDPDLEDDDPAEEDDPSGQCDEDGVNTNFGMVSYTPGASGPGCALSDPGGCEHDGREPEAYI
ncbi:hypothetical protein O4H52_14750 [Sphingomonadaceae bacterium G21617-S1]|nr:hypothetical protein [Sphingomonadaceae bacterium G21617-S1]